MTSNVKAICLLIAASSCAWADPSPPAEAALKFMQAVQSGSVDLAHGAGTAISPHTGPEKVGEIAGRLKRMVHDIGQNPLRVGRVKTHGDLAAVLIWKDHGFDPSDMQVFPVAMIKQENRWLPAPVPASFENCGVSYHKELRQPIQALENWMLRQRVLDLATLREQSTQRMHQKIAKSISADTLKLLEPKQVVQRFLDACDAGRKYEILGLMGGLSNPLPENWALRATSAEKAISQTHPSSPWRLLMASNVLRSMVHFEEDTREALASIVCLDAEVTHHQSEGLPQIRLVHLNLKKSKQGLWQVDPPNFFWQPADSHASVADPTLDGDLLNQFAKSIRQTYPATPLESPEQAEATLVEKLQNGKFTDLIPLLDIDGEPDKGLMGLVHAAQIWGGLHGLSPEFNPWSVQLVLPLGRTTTTDRAAVSCQIFSARKPDHFEHATLYLKATAGGWLWNAKPSAKIVSQFQDWSQQQADQWLMKWRQRMVSKCPVVSPIPSTDAPTEEQCRTLVASWVKAIEDGKIEEALKHCALLDIADSPTMLLRNLGYELTGALRKERRPTLQHVIREQGIAAVGMLSHSGDQLSFPLYPVVSTASGPRILLEVDLIAAGGRGRQFLNRTSINRLSNSDALAASTLKQLYTRHEQQCLPPAPDPDR